MFFPNFGEKNYWSRTIPIVGPETEDVYLFLSSSTKVLPSSRTSEETVLGPITPPVGLSLNIGTFHVWGKFVSETTSWINRKVQGTLLGWTVTIEWSFSSSRDSDSRLTYYNGSTKTLRRPERPPTRHGTNVCKYPNPCTCPRPSRTGAQLCSRWWLTTPWLIGLSNPELKRWIPYRYYYWLSSLQSSQIFYVKVKNQMPR